jgi:hypothetical protein
MHNRKVDWGEITKADELNFPLALMKETIHMKLQDK